MSLHPRNENTNRYPLFREILGDPTGKTVLDFGGNRGNLLHFSGGEIDEGKYTSVDVDTDGIRSGRMEFPTAKWVHYDRYNSMYAHSGKRGYNFPQIPPAAYVWAYSVFSHTTLDEFTNTLGWLSEHTLKKMAVSYLSLDSLPLLRYFYDRRNRHYGSAYPITDLHKSSVNVAYLSDHNKIVLDDPTYEPPPSNHFVAFYRDEWLHQQLSNSGLNVGITHAVQPSVPFITYIPRGK